MRSVTKFFMVLGLAVVASFAGADRAGAAGWPAQVTAVNAKAGQTISTKGDLKNGKVIDLAWAAKSSVACFPATENVNFSGNHVQFATQIPKQSEMVITVVPDDPKTDISVYAYQIGSTNFTSVAPSLSSATSCEAGYDAKNDNNPGKEEKVRLNATTNPYNVVIGVAGAKGTASGGFTLKVELKSSTGTTASAALTPIALTSEPNKTVEVTGSLGKGGKVDLAWAANSSVACFPATENANFTGNHVLYKTQIPKNSDMLVTAVPKDAKTDLSVYAYEVSTTDTTSIPPSVTRVTSCEAGYDAKKDNNPGVTESVKLTAINNPYAVYIGVVGANGTTAGDYTLKVELKSR